MNKIILVFSIVLSLSSCNFNNSNEENAIAVPSSTEVEIVENTNLFSPQDFIGKFEIKEQAIIENTNFDNIDESYQLNEQEITFLKLNSIYKYLNNNNYQFTIYKAYRINFNEDFYSLVFNVYKGEHELETILINYDKDFNIIAQKVIAYDEIAESMFRKHAVIDKNIITIYDEFYQNETSIDTFKFHINMLGEINPIVTKLKSNLRPSEIIQHKKIYVDTIQFDKYEDDSDYYLIYGQKGANKVSLVYEWDWQSSERYNFTKGNNIAVKWKMDSIYLAGDGETLDFKEHAIDAYIVLDEFATNYETNYQNEISYYFYKDYNFTDKFLDELYTNVQYYLTYTNDSLVKVCLAENAPFEYSIEEQKRQGKNYIVLGLSAKFNKQSQIVKWLYYDINETTDLYEYDLANDKLIKFNPKEDK